MDISFKTQHIRGAGHDTLAGRLICGVVGEENPERGVDEAVNTRFPFRVFGLEVNL